MNERIGPYLVESRLGVGGMGVVYAARDEALQRRVALKVISPHLADDEEFRARFVREARAMASLDSPHVVQVYAHGETSGQLWIATQLVPDGDLGTLLRRSGAPPLALAVDLIAQVASGLADAHAAGLVHRDIKPANVLLRRTGASYAAYLADFGIARRAGGEQTGLTQGVVGTPSYMAPELHTGAAAGTASDIYSLGCLLWSTLAGHAPFGGTSDYQVASAHLEQPVPQLEGDSLAVREVNRVLRTAMAKEPTARYRDSASLRDDLRAIQTVMTDTPTAVRGATPTGPASSVGESERGRGRRLALAGVALLLVAGVSVAVFVGWRSGHSEDRDPADPVTAAPATAGNTATERPTDSSPTESPTSDSPTADASTPAATGDFTAAQRKAAVQSFTSLLRTQPMVTEESADCIAESVVDEMGLPTLVDQGFFDEGMSYVDQDLADHPEMKTALASATFSCISAG